MNNKKTRLSPKHILNPQTRTCPKCNSDWDGGSILETFIKQRDDGVHWQGKTDEQIEEDMKRFYGEPYRWGREIGVELPWDHPNHYDGVSYIMCPDCNTTFNRFTGVEEEIPPGRNKQ